MDAFKKSLFVLLLTAFGFNWATAQPMINTAKINITRFSVVEKDNRLLVDWATDGTMDTNYWKVEASHDGNTFQTIALVMGPLPGAEGDRYLYREPVKTGVQAKKYFRVRHIGVNGAEQVSEIIKLNQQN